MINKNRDKIQTVVSTGHCERGSIQSSFRLGQNRQNEYIFEYTESKSQTPQHIPLGKDLLGIQENAQGLITFCKDLSQGSISVYSFKTTLSPDKTFKFNITPHPYDVHKFGSMFFGIMSAKPKWCVYGSGFFMDIMNKCHLYHPRGGDTHDENAYSFNIHNNSIQFFKGQTPTKSIKLDERFTAGNDVRPIITFGHRGQSVTIEDPYHKALLLTHTAFETDLLRLDFSLTDIQNPNQTKDDEQLKAQEENRLEQQARDKVALLEQQARDKMARLERQAREAKEAPQQAMEAQQAREAREAQQAREAKEAQQKARDQGYITRGQRKGTERSQTTFTGAATSAANAATSAANAVTGAVTGAANAVTGAATSAAKAATSIFPSLPSGERFQDLWRYEWQNAHDIPGTTPTPYFYNPPEGHPHTSNVYANANGERWYATIRYGGRTHYLGSFATRDDAVNAYNTAARKHNKDALQHGGNRLVARHIRTRRHPKRRRAVGRRTRHTF